MNRDEHNRIFCQWVERYGGILRKTARAFAPNGDQDDLHQELLIAVWTALPAFRGEASESTFIYRVAHNYALTWVRTRRNRERTLERYQLERPVAKTEHPVDVLYEEIRKLPELDRALVLLYLDEVSYHDMAKVLGISESNIGVRINRVKKKLAEQFKEARHGV
jgi:RNA polymerase sigma-70 factor (ECF subfamily)